VEIKILGIEGLDEFRKNLKKIDSDLPKVLRLALNEAANVVVDEAKPRIPTLTGKARASVKAKSSQREVRIQGGGRRAPYYPWLDFGGRVGRNDSVVRPFYSEGRYIYDAYYQKRDDGTFDKVLIAALVDVARQAGIQIDD